LFSAHAGAVFTGAGAAAAGRWDGFLQALAWVNGSETAMIGTETAAAGKKEINLHNLFINLGSMRHEFPTLVRLIYEVKCMAEVLIIENDGQSSKLLARILTQAGHCCREVKSPAKAGEYQQALGSGLVVMNARLPWKESLSFLSNLSQRRCPVLFITREAGTRDHLLALYTGPCQVLIRPFSDQALLHAAEELLKETENRLTLGSLEINLEEKAVKLAGEPLNLTAQEFALLQALMENPETALSREQLLRTAWGYQGIGETRTVDVHVQRLRKKLGEDRIETVYKLGYRLKMA
jgi:DNA-binding response OmpR family regulator